MADAPSATDAETKAFEEAFQKAAAHFRHLMPQAPFNPDAMPPLVIRNGKFSL